MAQISLRSIMMMCVYAAICSFVYVSPNLWVGWLVVIATAIWMSLAIIRAFESRDHFMLGFAVTGSSWLIIWLGFAIQTPTSFDGNSIRSNIYRFVNLGRTHADSDFDPALPITEYAQLHDLYTSGAMATQSSTPPVPAWHNAIRLLVCLSALAAAGVGGTLFQFRYRFKRRA